MNGMSVAVRWLTHPVTVVSTVVLLLNDHVLKGLWPGWFTGKLSDLSGLVMAPALLGFLLAVAVPRLSPGVLRTVSVLAVGAGFAWVKTVAAGAAFASDVWSVVNGPSVILRDPTDLLALPGVMVAWFVWERARRQQPIGGDAARRVRLAVVLPVAVIAVAATSPPAPPHAVVGVDEVDGRIRVSGDFGSAISDTGTGGWRTETEPASVEAQLDEPYDMDSELSWRRQATACVPDDPEHCYRVRGDGGDKDPSGEVADSDVLGVDETFDGGRVWSTSWEVPPERWLFLKRAHGHADSFGAQGLLSSIDVLVREVPGGHQVFVANGIEGLAVRDVDGSWSRVGVRLSASDSFTGTIDMAPLPLTTAWVATDLELTGSALIAAFALCWLLLVAWLFRRPRPRVWVPLSVATALIPVSFFVLVWHDFIGDPIWFLPAFSLGLVAATAFGMAMTLTDRGTRLVGRLAGGSIAVGLAFYAPYFGWSLGVPQAFPRKLSLIAAGVVFVLVAILVSLPARGRPKSAPPAPG